MTPVEAQAKPAGSPEQSPGTLRAAALLPAEDAQDRLWNLLAVVLITIAVVIGVGAWTYSRMQESLREIRSRGLLSSLESESRALGVWMDEKKRDAERRALAPEILREAAELSALARIAPDFSGVCAPGRQKALATAIAPVAAIEESVAFRLVDPQGRTLASRQPENCGRVITDGEFFKRLAPAFEGRSVFIRPLADDESAGAARAGESHRVLVWVATPVRAPGGSVIAALVLGRSAEQGFSRLLASGLPDTTRESYAFDVQGRMLTETRYRQELIDAGLLAQGQSGVLSVLVREPAPRTALAPVPAGGERPLTALARAAIRQRATGEPEGDRGVLLEPYRNYRGAEVIGAWRWFPEKEMALAVEIEAAEAYGPLQYLEGAFNVLFGFLLVALLGAGSVSLWAIRMRAREARRVGQYRIEREIGEGGLSHVYLARHTHLKRPTAVKVLKSHLASDEVVTRFQREVQLCSQLSHPNTIEIFDYGRTKDGSFFYAMEYLHGISLQDLIVKDGPMPSARVVYLLLQACGSLDEAHARGLVHRDIKPANLMLCVRGGKHDVLKVLDFGLVKESRNPHTRDITQFAKVLGTPLYMAPERLRNASDADARADIYALGAVAHFLLTGRELFETQSDHDLFYQVMNVVPALPTECGAADVPPELESLIRSCVAKDRDQRPGSIADVVSILEELARRKPWRQQQAREWWERSAAALGIGAGPDGTKTRV